MNHVACVHRQTPTTGTRSAISDMGRQREAEAQGVEVRSDHGQLSSGRRLVLLGLQGDAKIWPSSRTT